MQQPFPEHRNTALWRAVSSAVAELQATNEIEIKTAPDYVVGYICRELTAKWVIASAALSRER